MRQVTLNCVRCGIDLATAYGGTIAPYKRCCPSCLDNAKPCLTCGRNLREVFPSLTSQKYCGSACLPRCSINGCDKVAAKRGLCDIHYYYHRTGIVPKKTWPEPSEKCLVCGRPGGGANARLFCSRNCQQVWRVAQGDRPLSRPCALCGEEFTLISRAKGRLTNSKKLLCDGCARYKKYHMTVQRLADRDGVDCSICGESVDMTLRRADSVFCPSIDHIVPRSLGGTNDPANLALAHFWCNAVKSNRLEFTI